MKLTAICACLAISTTSAHADALVCRDFLAMNESLQAVFVSGLVDGMRTMHGVNNTFARHIKAATSSEDERNGVEKLRSIPQQYLSRGDALSKSDITTKIAKGCKIKPELPVGNYLTDALSGEL